MTVSIIIPNWNGRAKMETNLPAVVKVSGVDEIIVTDDASTDDSVSWLEANYPQIKLVKRSQNGGFSSNVNTGVKVASGDLIFLLNSDARPQPDSLAKALPHFDNPQVFSVGCNVGGTWAWAKWQNGFFWHNQAKTTALESHQTLWASGGSAVFRKDYWQQLNGLDELFDPFYEEDLDLGYRATKRGWLNIFEPTAKVEHYKQKGVIEENFSKAKVATVAQRNILLFTWKNITDSGMITSHILALIWMVIRHPGYLRIVLAALQRLPQLLPKRQFEHQQAKLTDRQILDLYSNQL